MMSIVKESEPCS